MGAGAGAGDGDDAGADDASGGWLVIGWIGAVVLAALAASAGVAAFGLPVAAPVGDEVPDEVGVLGLDEPDVDDDDGELEPPEEGPDELIGLVEDVDGDEPVAKVGLPGPEAASLGAPGAPWPSNGLVGPAGRTSALARTGAGAWLSRNFGVFVLTT